ncbi:EamA family transporter [Clostridium sp. D53t1_180928_C8]|uniref:EamA family transporter n=1 Tax=Clostridium sp. D53t1_180928_C8 TaxID=2787101 RepID=UPI0018A9381F|nr:EamA family transporter [Clostridium sp. D53t1_180928_C8]
MSNIIIYLMLLIGTLLGAFGGFYLKKSTAKEGIIGIIMSPFLYLGGFSYLISAVLNIIVLKYLPYSVVLPLTAITYIWSLVIAYCFLKEKITKVKIYGIICIMIGAIFISI